MSDDLRREVRETRTMSDDAAWLTEAQKIIDTAHEKTRPLVPDGQLLCHWRVREWLTTSIAAALAERDTEITRLRDEAPRLVEDGEELGYKKGYAAAMSERAQPASADYMERAHGIVLKYIRLGCKFVVGKNVHAEDMKKDIGVSLATVAREERERCAELIEDGRFLPIEAPDARLAKEAAKAIRAFADPKDKP
jgi:hypothetical protein